MAKSGRPKKRRIKKQRVWATALISLFLSLLMAACVVTGTLYYAYNGLETQLTVTKSLSKSYAAALSDYLADGVNRAAVYADILASNYFGAPGSASLSTQLAALKELDGFEDVGVVEENGAVTSTDGLLSKAAAERLFALSSANGAQAILLSPGAAEGLAFAAPIRRGTRLEGTLYLADTGALSLGAAAEPLFEGSSCLVLDGENRLIAFTGAAPAAFDYEEIRLSGLLFSEDREANLRELLRAVKAASGSEASGERGRQLIFETVRGDDQLSMGAWFENELAINGWKSLSYVEKQLDEFSLRQGALIVLGTALLILLPLLFTIRSTVLQLRANKKLSQALLFDPITSGNNFQYFRKEAEKLLRKRRHRNKVLAVVIIDVNGFRAFSDVHGPGEGELLLIRIFNYLNKALNRDELLARYAADQFSLLLIFEPEEEPTARVSRILKGLSRLYPGERTAYSAGIYVVTDRTVPVESMNNFASVAKDAARDGGLGSLALYTNAMREKLVFEQQVAGLMEKALKNGEFVLYLQPKYSVSGEALAGAEALVRWNSPERGFVSPGQFIPLFERNGFIVKLDAYMLSSVAALQKRWLDQGRTLFPISVNLSRVNFLDAGLAKKIRALVDEVGAPYSSIELELTESAFFDDRQALLYTVNQLRRWGFSVSMDDFGSGYSSLNALKDLPMDVVKLDRGFFLDTDDPKKGEAVVRGTIRLAKELGLTVVAEGIETKEQVDFLRSTDCDMIQGFYYAKPMPIDEFEQLSRFPTRGLIEC